MKNTDSNSRIVTFDILRVVLITLVVNLHIQFVTHTKANFLSPFGWYAVPLFITLSFYLMSKYFLQKKLHTKIIFQRSNRLVVPLITWSTVGFALHPEMLHTSNIIKQLLTGSVVNVPLYYLNLMIIFSFLYWCITHLPKQLRLPLYAGIILLSIYLEYSKLNFLFFTNMEEVVKDSYGRFIELIKFASLGIIFGGLIQKIRFQKLVLLILLGVSYLVYTHFADDLPPWGFDYPGLEYFSGVIIVFSLLLLLPKLILPQRLTTAIETLGKYSFGVYLLHQVLLEALLKFFPALFMINSAFPWLFLSGFMIFCYCVCILIMGLSRKKLAFLIS